MSELLDKLHAIGLPMGTKYAGGHYVGWTTDQADAALEAGAAVTPYTSRDPTCSGWEVSVWLNAEHEAA